MAVNSQFSVIGKKMKLTGWNNDNDMRNATCADTQISLEWFYTVHPLYRLYTVYPQNCCCNVCRQSLSARPAVQFKLAANFKRKRYWSNVKPLAM